MNTRFLITGTVAAGLALFVWQSISNVAIPWHNATMRAFPDSTAMVQTVRAGVPENGLYYAEQGILTVVSFRPDMADKSQFMGPMLGKQFVNDLIIALLFCVVLTMLPRMTAAASARTLALAALAAGLTIHVSNTIWYGYPTAHTLVNTFDMMIGWAIAGLVIGWLANRAAGAKAPGGGVRAESGLAASAGRSGARV